ncbi:sigma-70 family RNA polymerase sigma factor [Micromonospora sp. C31]|uniref:RNA polymerase sigma factor n=1 Tax=Micromonospora sp. C31 TaxID=2824876 RepID=UPI001B36F55B|nr:sigma-70 family RNA polymerase sigma factor [Micromonospora sp. C31]MBQ1075907.1 sigma-70 family RNA polymerase sigma factor [Micromonospora sp. C31]
MDTAARDDTALVEAVRRGERAGLEGMYRRYADRLYTYARTMLRDPEAAADAVHDAFLIAGQRIGQLREPDRLRSWLYAIVRTECLRQLRDRSRCLPLEEAGEPVADVADPGTGVNAQQVRALVHAALAALNPGDREVVHLAIRHDLSSADIGAALGVPANHAHARLSRARSQLERALGALLVARAGARDCPALADLIDGWQGRLTPTLRKRVSRHIESCAACGLLRREQLSPATLLSAYTAPAFLVVADTVWPRLAETWATGVAAGTAPGPADATRTEPAPGEAAAAQAAPTPDPGAAPAGPGTDGPTGTRDAATADAAADGPTPTADGAAATVDGAAVAPGGAAATVDGAAAGPDIAAVPRGAAHTVRTTSPASRDRRRRRMAASAALLVLLAALGTWSLASGRPTAARHGSGQPVSETLGSPAGDPVTPASAPRSPAATDARTRAADPPPVGAAAPTPGTQVVPTPGTQVVPAPPGGGAARTDAPDAPPGGVAPTPSRPPTVPRPTGAPRVAAPFTVSATTHVRCGSDTYTLVVQASGSAALGGAEVRWTPDGGRTSVRAMTVDGSAARVSVGQLRVPTLTWSVRVTSTDGRTAQSPIRTATDPCVRPG